MVRDDFEGLKHGFTAGGRKPDFDYFDLILIMDEENYADLRLLEPTAQQFDKVHYLREFDPVGGPRFEVPDPAAIRFLREPFRIWGY